MQVKPSKNTNKVLLFFRILTALYVITVGIQFNLFYLKYNYPDMGGFTHKKLVFCNLALWGGGACVLARSMIFYWLGRKNLNGGVRLFYHFSQLALVIVIGFTMTYLWNVTDWTFKWNHLAVFSRAIYVLTGAVLFQWATYLFCIGITSLERAKREAQNQESSGHWKIMIALSAFMSVIGFMIMMSSINDMMDVATYILEDINAF